MLKSSQNSDLTVPLRADMLCVVNLLSVCAARGDVGTRYIKTVVEFFQSSKLPTTKSKNFLLAKGLDLFSCKCN